MATKKIKRFESGGVSDKDRGLEESKDEKVGFFERMRMGNIDEEGSEAYNRFGAGRGKASRTPVEDMKGTPVVRESAAAAASSATPEMDPLEAANAREPIPVPAGPKARPGEVGSNVIIGGRPSIGSPAPAKSPPKQAQTYSRTSGDTGARPKADTSNYSNEGRGREMTKQQQFEKADAEARSPEGVAKRKKQESDQGLERVTPETALLPGGGLRALSEAAKRLAAPKMAKYAQEALPAPTKRLSYDKAGAFSRKRSGRAEAQREEMLKENAKRYGLDEDAPGYGAAADAVRKGLGGKDFSLKKGGSLKRSAPVKKMASGGMVSNASKRADGIATKGKTRCKMR
jgi:hypothetical protein